MYDNLTFHLQPVISKISSLVINVTNGAFLPCHRRSGSAIMSFCPLRPSLSTLAKALPTLPIYHFQGRRHDAETSVGGRLSIMPTSGRNWNTFVWAHQHSNSFPGLYLSLGKHLEGSFWKFGNCFLYVELLEKTRGHPTIVPALPSIPSTPFQAFPSIPIFICDRGVILILYVLHIYHLHFQSNIALIFSLSFIFPVAFLGCLWRWKHQNKGLT